VASLLSVAQTTVLIGVYPCLTEGYLKKQSQKPAFGRKSEVRIPKSDNSGGVAGRLLPVSVGIRVERVHLKKQSQFAGLCPEIRNTKL
jgi:hypothetical protein